MEVFVKSFLVVVLSYSLFVSQAFAQRDPHAFATTGFKTEKNNYEKRLKKAKNLEEYLSVSREVFEKSENKTNRVLSRVSDDKLETTWLKLDQDASLSSVFKIKGETAREKIIYVTSMDFFDQVEKKVRQEVKTLGGFEKFKAQYELSASSNCFEKQTSCKEQSTQRGIASDLAGDIVGWIVVGIACIIMLPFCIMMALAAKGNNT
jgi:hypothetical protein